MKRVMYCRVQGIFLFGVGFSRVVDFWVWGLRGDGFGVGSKKKGGGGGEVVVVEKRWE